MNCAVSVRNCGNEHCGVWPETPMGEKLFSKLSNIGQLSLSKAYITASLFDGGLFSTNFDSMTLARLTLIRLVGVRFIQHVFLVPLEI